MTILYVEPVNSLNYPGGTLCFPFNLGIGVRNYSFHVRRGERDKGRNADYLSCLALAPSLLQFFLPPSHPSAPLPSFSPQKLFILIYRKALAIIMPSSPCRNVLSIFPLFFFFQQGNSQPSFRSHIIHYVYWYPFLNCSDYGESSLNTCKAP